MISGNVQVRSFRFSWDSPTPTEPIHARIAALWDEVNAFLLTLSPDRILDIRYDIYPTSKYSGSSICQILVLYYQP